MIRWPWSRPAPPASPVLDESAELRAQARETVERADRLADQLLANMERPPRNGTPRHA